MNIIGVRVLVKRKSREVVIFRDGLIPRHYYRVSPATLRRAQRAQLKLMESRQDELGN